MINRRGLITGLISFVAAPAVVKASSIMPVKAWSEVDIVTLKGLRPYQKEMLAFILDSTLSYSNDKVGEVWVPYTAEKAVEEMTKYGKVRILSKVVYRDNVYSPFFDKSS